MKDQTDYVINIQKKYTEKERYNIAHKYDNIYKVLRYYLNKKEYDDINKFLLNHILYYKYNFNVDRPYVLDNNIIPVHLESAQTPSYPSGHSTQYWFFYLYIKKYKNKDIKDLALRGSLSRIIAGVHYHMDENAGIELAEKLFTTYCKHVHSYNTKH